MNNLTFYPLYKIGIGRADIEESKSDVAMNAWPPQASYPCGNFSDTSSFVTQISKGSLGQTFQCSDSYWKSKSNQLLPLTTRGSWNMERGISQYFYLAVFAENSHFFDTFCTFFQGYLLFFSIFSICRKVFSIALFRLNKWIAKT